MGINQRSQDEEQLNKKAPPPRPHLKRMAILIISSASLLVFLFATLSIFSRSYADDLKPPPMDVTQEALLQYLSLGDGKIDLPAIYVFGDSFVDCGNNNYLDTFSKGNFLPYGVDFDGKATGRFTNGRLAVDFIARVAGLPFPAPMMSLSEKDRKTIRTGINYGSSSAGILPDTAVKLMKHILPLDTQIDLFENTTKGLRSQLPATNTSMNDFTQYLSKSLFFIHVAANDLGLGWEYKNISVYSPESYAKLLSEELSKRLQRLYELGARKFLVHNVFPMGCQPFNINTFHPKTQCVEDVNSRISAYNKLLPDMLSKLQTTLAGSKFVHGDLYKVFEDVFASPAHYGFNNVTGFCCIDSARNGTRGCLPDSQPCKDRNSLVFFDPFHPSEHMHFLWARRFLKDPSVCSPTLFQLIQN